MTFNRQKTADLFDPTSDVFLASSADGLNWSIPQQVTSDSLDQTPDLWPNLVFAPVAQQWYLNWTSTAFVSGGAIALPIGGQYATNAIDLYKRSGIVGWSIRTAGPLAIWVNSTTRTPQLWSAIAPF
jgi:hypothetical protein